MTKPHFLIRRSRSGRFNFTLLAPQGRITGVVTVPTAGRTKGEIEAEARDRISALAGVLADVTDPGGDIEADDDSDPRRGAPGIYN